MNHPKVPIPSAELVTNVLVQGTTPADAANRSTTSGRPASSVEEPIIFMTKSEVEAM